MIATGGTICRAAEALRNRSVAVTLLVVTAYSQAGQFLD